MKAKVKAAIFIRNKRECGLRYALLWYLDLPYSFNSSHSYRLKKLSDWAYDWCNLRYQKCRVPVGSWMHEPEFIEYLPETGEKSQFQAPAAVQPNLDEASL